MLHRRCGHQAGARSGCVGDFLEHRAVQSQGALSEFALGLFGPRDLTSDGIYRSQDCVGHGEAGYRIGETRRGSAELLRRFGQYDGGLLVFWPDFLSRAHASASASPASAKLHIQVRATEGPPSASPVTGWSGVAPTPSRNRLAF